MKKVLFLALTLVLLISSFDFVIFAEDDYFEVEIIEENIKADESQLLLMTDYTWDDPVLNNVAKELPKFRTKILHQMKTEEKPYPNAYYYIYLIDLYQDELGQYYSSPVPQGNIWQSQENQFTGRSEEWTFAGSANFYDQLYIGASANLRHIKREGTRDFMESSVAGDDTDFNQWSFKEDLRSNAWGGNLKVGFLYHANPWLRIGAAFHSPSIYNFEESWQTETESQISWVTRKYISPNANYEYTFFSPLKWVGSLAFVIAQRGLISFDAEYTNFGAARFRASDYNYDAVNESIKSTFGRTLNFRIGSEWLLGTSYLRLGAGYYGSPFGFGENNGSVKKASLGFGLPVSEATTFDFAYELSYGTSNIYLYDAGELGIESILQSQFKNNLAVTMKVRF
jgi:hypothetical protein